jgi:hypothetical protein
MKLNVLLAKTDHLSASYKKGITEYVKFFKDKQAAFKGEKKTYTPAEGTIDVPANRKNELVVTTVDEKLEYLVESSTDYINAKFSQEATNSSGLAVADLTVDGIVIASNLTSLELLSLKTLLENGDLESMYASIPVRSDAEIWSLTSNEMYASRAGIFETELVNSTNKTTTKTNYILPDPNIAALAENGKYTPSIAQTDVVQILGEQTLQRFSGEYTHRQRAEILKNRTKLLTATIEALKIANDTEAKTSTLTATTIFGFLHTGKIS